LPARPTNPTSINNINNTIDSIKTYRSSTGQPFRRSSWTPEMPGKEADLRQPAMLGQFRSTKLLLSDLETTVEDASTRLR